MLVKHRKKYCIIIIKIIFQTIIEKNIETFSKIKMFGFNFFYRCIELKNGTRCLCVKRLVTLFT